MKLQPKAVLHQLKTRQLDPDSVTAREIAAEVAERVLRDLTPSSNETQSFSCPRATTAKHPA